MADLGGVFNANEVEPDFGFKLLPNGDYPAVIASSESKPNSKGTGTMLVLKWQVIDGEHRGGTVFTRLNLNNPSPDAVRIARSELSAICRAVGVMTPSDSSQLHDLPCIISVVCEKRSDDPSKMSNVIKAYKSRQEYHAQQQTQAPPQSGRPW